MDLNEFLQGKKIEDVKVIRGLGIIPAYMRIVVSEGAKKYYLDTEVNFRVIYKKQMILCFDDMFLDEKHNEISIRKYRSQVNVEKSLIQSNLEIVRKRIYNRKIKKVAVTTYGDVVIFVSSSYKLQIINDTHLNESCIFRLLSGIKDKEIVANNGKKYYVESTLYEILNNRSNGIEINNKL